MQGELPADALAVLFSDPGELAAALVWEVANRTAPDRWWWQSLVSDPATLRELPKAFTREPRYIPAAVDHLIAWGRAERVALALTPSQARELAILMCEVYRLDRLLDVIRGDLDQPTDDNFLGADKGATSAQSFSERSKTRGQGDRKGLAEGAFRDAVSTFDEGFPERFDREFDGRGDATKNVRSDAVWPDGAEADGQDPPSLYRSIGGGEATPTVAKPPWRGSLDSAPWLQRLGRERAALLGIASAIVRKPSEAPGRGFAAQF